MKLTSEQCLDALPYFAEIVEQLGLVSEFGKLRLNKDKKPKTTEEVEKAGLEFILYIVKNSGKCKVAFFEFVAILMGCTPDEAKKKPPAETIGVLKELVEDKELLGFFRSAV